MVVKTLGMVVKTLGKLEPGTPRRAHLSAHQAMQSSLGNSLLTASACPRRAPLWAQQSAQQEALLQKLEALEPEQVARKEALRQKLSALDPEQV